MTTDDLLLHMRKAIIAVAYLEMADDAGWRPLPIAQDLESRAELNREADRYADRFLAQESDTLRNFECGPSDAWRMPALVFITEAARLMRGVSHHHNIAEQLLLMAAAEVRWKCGAK